MDKAKILDFLKKNFFALSCGVVALAAVVASFYPFGGMVQDLQQKSQTEAGGYGTITAFTKGRHFPQVDPAKTAPVDLTSFPNKAQLDVGQKAVAKLTAESLGTVDVLMALNDDKRVHPLLVPDALPSPVSDTPKFLFAAVYKNALSTDPTLSGLSSPAVPPPIQGNPGTKPELPVAPMAADEKLATVHALNLCNDVLHAGSPPDAKLVEARRAWLGENVFAPQIVTGPDGLPVNRTEVDAKFADASKAVPDQLAQEIADAKHVYLDADAFAVQSSFVSNTTNPQLADIWFAQLSFWMQRDMALAVAGFNAGGKGIPASPVKRILRLSLPPAPMYLFAAGATGTPDAAIETAALPVTFAASPTGRTSNGMYDVVPFRLTVDVEADQVNPFITGLTKDRLIYIYNQDLFTINAETLAPMGYLYGPRPVVRLVLSGEELFLRKWSTPLMPDRIKILLGLETAPAGSTLAPAGTDSRGMPPGMPAMGGGMPPGMPAMGGGVPPGMRPGR